MIFRTGRFIQKMLSWHITFDREQKVAAIDSLSTSDWSDEEKKYGFSTSTV